MQRLERVLEALRSANLTLNPTKCRLFKKQVQFLGHVVSAAGVCPDPSKVAAVKRFPTPVSPKNVREFLGLPSYFRRFIPKFADVARPLHKLLEKSSRFVWTDECDAAFRVLKEKLMSAPVLCYPKFSAPFILTTDASEVGLGAVLTQEEDGQERVVAYASRSLSKVERRFSATERECLGLVWATRRFRVYLHGRRFVLRTDHNPLVHLRKSKDPRGKLARWILELEALDYDLQYLPGSALPHADALSRGPVDKIDDVDEAAVKVVTLDDDYAMVVAQCEDPEISEVMELVKAGKQCPSAASKTVRHYMSQQSRLKIDQQGRLVCVFLRDHVQHSQVIVPRSRNEEILAMCHEDPASGHLGVSKTLERIRTRFYWSTMFRDVKTWVKTCRLCAMKKSLPAPGRAPFGEMPKPERPWQWVKPWM